VCWLEQRGIAASLPAGEQPVDCSSYGVKSVPSSAGATATAKYPVFIVAAEGGGIYAASAASVFLAKLQDAAPHFTEHVFAISGVSGGAIGAAIFQALDHAAHPDPPVTTGALTAAGPAISCVRVPPTLPKGSDSTLAPKVASIMQDDHFSPVVGSIFPEIFGAPLTRPDALVASFEYSASAQDAAAGRNLCSPFRRHWSPVSVAPALVLNSTWVEMGFRVAFAPFHLHDTDESLYSFSDTSMPALRDNRCRDSTKEKQTPCVSVMSAAAVSARFPLIMPPFSVVMPATPTLTTDNAADEKAPEFKRWNFVDGAYSDNSGATTALDLYRALQSVRANVQLQVILITSANPEPNLNDRSINGTVFRDTMAPIDAIMKVREDLGNDAVARACTYIYEEQLQSQNGPDGQPRATASGLSATEYNEPCVDHSGDKSAPLQMVEIQDQTYGLALGWKISKTSFEIVSWMLGNAGDCHRYELKPSQDSAAPVDAGNSRGAPAGQSDLAHLSKPIVDRNSCVLKSIVELIGDPVAPASPPAAPAPSGAAQ